jgi:hypothetical protein
MLITSKPFKGCVIITEGLSKGGEACQTINPIN